MKTLPQCASIPHSFSPAGSWESNEQNGTWWAELGAAEMDEDLGDYVLYETYGILSGKSKCEDTSESIAASEESGEYMQTCFCQAQTFTPNGGTQCAVASPKWVQTVDMDHCTDQCPGECAYAALMGDISF